METSGGGGGGRGAQPHLFVTDTAKDTCFGREQSTEDVAKMGSPSRCTSYLDGFKLS